MNVRTRYGITKVSPHSGLSTTPLRRMGVGVGTAVRVLIISFMPWPRYPLTTPITTTSNIDFEVHGSWQ
jgi:hypothetical protein